MSLKSFVTNVWKKLLSSVKKTYKKVDELANKLCPVAIDVVEAMKKINVGFDQGGIVTGKQIGRAHV